MTMATDEQNVWFNATHWCGIIGHGVVKCIMFVLSLLIGGVIGWSATTFIMLLCGL